MMFNTNSFQCESAIKKMANAMVMGAFIFMGLAALASFIVFCNEPEYTWWVALIVAGGGALVGFFVIASSRFVWGYGDIIGNTARLASTPAVEAAVDAVIQKEELPEL